MQSAAENAADCGMWQLLQTNHSQFSTNTVHTILPVYSGPLMLKMLDRLNQGFDNLVLHCDLFKEDIMWDAERCLSLTVWLNLDVHQKATAVPFEQRSAQGTIAHAQSHY